MSVNLKIDFEEDFRSDCGLNQRYPDGTMSKIGVFIDEDTGTKLFVKIFFLPDGGREFAFYGGLNVTETLSGLMSMGKVDIAPKVCFRPDELVVLNAILVWLTDHKDEIYRNPIVEE